MDTSINHPIMTVFIHTALFDLTAVLRWEDRVNLHNKSADNIITIPCCCCCCYTQCGFIYSAYMFDM